MDVRILLRHSSPRVRGLWEQVVQARDPRATEGRSFDKANLPTGAPPRTRPVTVQALTTGRSLKERQSLKDSGTAILAGLLIPKYGQCMTGKKGGSCH